MKQGWGAVLFYSIIAFLSRTAQFPFFFLPKNGISGTWDPLVWVKKGVKDFLNVKTFCKRHDFFVGNNFYWTKWHTVSPIKDITFFLDHYSYSITPTLSKGFVSFDLFKWQFFDCALSHSARHGFQISNHSCSSFLNHFQIICIFLKVRTNYQIQYSRNGLTIARYRDNSTSLLWLKYGCKDHICSTICMTGSSFSMDCLLWLLTPCYHQCILGYSPASSK